MRKAATLALGLAWVMLGPARAWGARIALEADYSSRRESTRVVLGLNHDVPYSISQPPGRVVVRFQDPRVQADFEDVLVQDGALERIAFETQDGRPTVVLHLGPEFRSYQPIVLRNPFRIVMELARRTPWEGPAKRAEAPRPAPEPPPATRAEDLETSVERELSDPKAEAAAPPVRVADSRIRTVVIDPGHGGVESGAGGAGGLLEKVVTLQIARRLKTVIEQNLGLRVILTRDADQELGLDERTAIANNNKADLFISVHANASPRADARGAETYFLSRDATDDASRRLAAVENQAIGVSDRSIYGTDLELILWDLAQLQYLEESQSLAETIQAELNAALGMRDRGVKQAPFRVLMGATMPAVLVEVGFISNPQEANMMAGAAHQQKIANAIYASILNFMRSRERRMGMASGAR